ncbi:uncharacterized protein LOC135056855 [Pseudophryne corroboree]|uniref:uncharacterized protein LOC135056855 n=1 Tax=Pseudophryne corroboree TaxID=495146 RepID=UPI003081A9F6
MGAFFQAPYSSLKTTCTSFIFIMGNKKRKPKWTVTVRKNMHTAGMYSKHSMRTPLIKGFRNYLVKTLEVCNSKQEVENVARYLYFMDPQKASMEFVENIEKTNLYFTKLGETGLCSQTQFNYLKSIRRFIQYQTTATNLGATDPQLFQACRHFLKVINAIQKKLCKGVSREKVIKKYKRLTKDPLQPLDCNQLLDVAKPDFLNCIYRADIGDKLLVKDKICILYYLEALLILKHLQRPGVVANMTVEEWHERVRHTFTSECISEILVIIGVKNHKTAANQVETFALTEEEEMWFKTYFDVVRPSLVKEDNPQEAFFISTSGNKIYKVSNDLRHFHVKHRLQNITSQMVRRACETWILSRYSDVQKSLFAKYLGHTNLTADRHYREKTLHNICLGSRLVTQLGYKSEGVDTQKSSGEELQDQSLSHWHHCKKERKDRHYKKRVKNIIRAFPAQRPSIVKLTKYIKKIKLKFSVNEVKLLVETWKPRPFQCWKHCKDLKKHIRLQNWKGLKTTTDKESGRKKVKSKRAFLKGEAICDFHGEQIGAKKGRKMQKNKKNCHDLYFYKDTEGKSWCINPSCTCHTRTYSKLMWKSSTEFNVIPTYTTKFGILLLAAENIPANQNLKYYVEK